MVLDSYTHQQNTCVITEQQCAQQADSSWWCSLEVYTLMACVFRDEKYFQNSKWYIFEWKV